MYKWKNLFEFFLLISLAIPLSLLILFLMLILFFPTKGKIFFIQKRIGKEGKEFNIVKFRTLRNEVTMPISKDENILIKASIPYGHILRKSGLDELPQFFNIIRGDMNFIGPRPLLFRELKHLSDSDFVKRHKLKPGITGLWQIQRQYNENDMDYIRLDLEYIAESSLWLDLKILFLTLLYCAKQKGI